MNRRFSDHGNFYLKWITNTRVGLPIIIKESHAVIAIKKKREKEGERKEEVKFEK